MFLIFPLSVENPNTDKQKRRAWYGVYHQSHLFVFYLEAPNKSKQHKEKNQVKVSIRITATEYVWTNID